MDLATASGLQLPALCEALRWLTPYAVLYCYDGEAEADEERLPRQEVREQLRQLRAWVEARLAADANPGHEQA